MPRGRPHKCIYCGSIDTVSKGSRMTKTLGIRKIRRCKGCNRKFTPKNQKMVQAPSDQASETQAEPANTAPPAAPIPNEPEDSLSADPDGLELNRPEDPTDGY